MEKLGAQEEKAPSSPLTSRKNFKKFSFGATSALKMNIC